MNPLIAIAIFAAYFMAGSLYALFVRYTNRGDATKAANCSVVISLLMTTSIMQCLDNPWYLIPLLAGNWLGTYAAIYLPKLSWRIPMIRFLACLVLALAACCLTAPRAEAANGRLLRAMWRVTTAPVAAARQVQLNSLERRAARGNQLAAARAQAISQCKTARACY